MDCRGRKFFFTPSLPIPIPIPIPWYYKIVPLPVSFFVIPLPEGKNLAPLLIFGRRCPCVHASYKFIPIKYIARRSRFVARARPPPGSIGAAPSRYKANCIESRLLRVVKIRMRFCLVGWRAGGGAVPLVRCFTGWTVCGQSARAPCAECSPYQCFGAGLFCTKHIQVLQ